MKELDKSVRLAAAHHLREIGNVRSSLLWVAEQPEGFAGRVDTFNAATFDVSHFAVLSGFKAKEMPNLVAFRRIYRKVVKEPTILSDLVDSFDYFLKNDPTGEYITETNESLRAIKKKLASGEWRFHPDVFSSPNTLLTRLLVEGYALDLERYYEQPGVAEVYKKALKEVLTKDYANKALTQDVLWWDLLERDSSRRVTAIEYLEQVKERQTDPLQVAADNLNRHFRENGAAHKVLDDIRKFPRPIAVDFNNVIANNNWPLKLNPDAPESLRALREMGNVFIVTSASVWRAVQGFMVEQGVWSPDIVLMTSPTYEFISQWQEKDPHGLKLREEYVQLANGLGWNYTAEDLCLPPGYKCVAPIFGKQWKIPLIDNSPEPTKHNPGVFGIEVKEWVPEEELGQDKWYEEWLAKMNSKKPSLSEAAEQVCQYFATLSQ